MTRRHLNKRASRIASDLRRGLVHAAGCTFRGYEVCANRQCVHEAAGQYEFDCAQAGLPEPARPVSVPRSLRPMLGRTVP